MTSLAFVLSVAPTLVFGANFGDDPNLGAFLPGQAAADVLRETTGAEGALIPSGLLHSSFSKEDLSTMLDDPGDTIVVLTLTGAHLKEAFARSLSMYPQPNVGFLQLSGFEIVFRKGGSLDTRIVNATINGAKIEDGRQYNVAMPTSLQRGQLGYSNLWEKAKVFRSYDKMTMHDLLKGRHGVSNSPRWVLQP